MNRHRIPAVALAAAVAALLSLAGDRAAVAQQPSAEAVTLKVGDAAPPLKVGKWVKGEPVAAFEPGTVYVGEMWATWCGPCVTAIPHITELQKKLEAKKVVMIGMNVFEQDESKVEPFVAQMGEKMGYRVATDDKSADANGAMATTWMRAAGRNGIPCSFIVDRKGKVAWIGHPMAMDAVLDKVVAGTFDPKAYAAAVAAAERKRQAGQQGAARQ